MTYVCQLEQQGELPVVSIRSHTPVEGLQARLGENYGAIMQYLSMIGQFPTGAPFVAYYNMDMQNLDIEVGFPVAKVLAGQGEIQSHPLPAGKIATTLHTGPYGEMAPAYGALTQWVTENGLQPSGAVYEFYLNDPACTPPAELMTRIVFPLLS